MEIKELWRYELIRLFIFVKTTFIFVLFFVITAIFDLPESLRQLCCSYIKVLCQITTDCTVATYLNCPLIACLKCVLIDIMQSIHPRLCPMFHQNVNLKEETSRSLQTGEDIVRMSREVTELWKSKTQDLHWIFLRTHGRLIAWELFFRHILIQILVSYVHFVKIYRCL